MKLKFWQIILKTLDHKIFVIYFTSAAKNQLISINNFNKYQIIYIKDFILR